MAVTPNCAAQFRLTDLSGRIITGVYRTRAEDLGGRTISFVPLTFDLQTAGYFSHPDFLSFDVKPILTSGPQATEAGFIGGNGVSATAIFLRRRAFPAKVFYNNLRREDVFYGGLSQVSGYRSVNHDLNYGANWDLRRARWPQVSLDWRRANLTSQPDISFLPEHKTRSSQAGATFTDRRLGWELLGSARRDRIMTDFSFPSSGTFSQAQMAQSNLQMEISGQRPVWKTGSLSLSGGDYKIRSSSGGVQFDQDLRVMSAGLRTDGKRRLRGGLRANYTSGVLGRTIRDSLASFSSSGGSLLPPATVLGGLVSQNYSNLSVSADVRYDVWPGVESYVTANEGKVWSPSANIALQQFDYLAATAGLRFDRKVSAWAQVSGDVHTTKGRTIYQNAEPGRMQGTGYSVRLQSGKSDRLEAVVSYNEERQSVEQTVLASTRWNNRWGDLNLTRKVPRWGLSFAAGAGLQDSAFETFNAEFGGKGYSANGNIQHRLGQASYSRYNSSGNTLTTLLTAAGGSGSGGILLPGLFLPSLDTKQRGQTLTARFTPVRRLEASVLYTHVYQEMNLAPLNEFRQILVTVTYRFRQLQFEAGYAKWEQSLFGTPGLLRDRLYFRVVRPFRVLSQQ